MGFFAQITSNMLVLLSVHVAMLLNAQYALAIHGCTPADLVASTIPIPKGRGVDITDSNYRGISLSSIYGKILDQVIMYKFSDKLVTSDLQFGFERKRSTRPNICNQTVILKETLGIGILL